MANPTLTVKQILAKVMSAYRIEVPAVNRMGTDYRSAAKPLTKDQTYIAKIAGLPSITSYDAGNGGYQAGAASMDTLLTDVPIVVDQHKKVSLKWSHLNALATNNQKQLLEVIGGAGFVLAQDVVNNAIGKCTSRESSNSITYSVANSDRDMLNKARATANTQKMLPKNRYGILNTDVMEVLDADSRMSNRDGVQGVNHNESTAYKVYNNVAGFSEVSEWPELPTNDGTETALTTVTNATDTYTLVAHGLEDGDRVQFTATALPTGLSAATDYYVRDAAADTFKVSATDGGAAVDITTDGTAVSFTRYENLTGLFFDPRGIAVLSGIPDDVHLIAESLGIPKVSRFETLTDPTTGMTMMAIVEQQQGTLDAFIHVTHVYGTAAGKQTSAATDGTLTDPSLLRLIKA